MRIGRRDLIWSGSSGEGEGQSGGQLALIRLVEPLNLSAAIEKCIRRSIVANEASISTFP